MRKLKKCYKILHEFVVNSTFHGLPHTVLAPHKWMRVVWVVLFLLAMCLCLSQGFFLMRKYASKPTEVVKKVSGNEAV